MKPTAKTKKNEGKVIKGKEYGFLKLTGVFKRPQINNKTRFYVEAVCKCGVVNYYPLYNLSIGKTKSCGCHRKNLMKGRFVTHGMTGHKLYTTWVKIKERVFYTKDVNYKNYGGRGIKICPEWMDFKNFVRDMGDKPSPKHSIDRINNDGDYCKENCRWATSFDQAQNKRNNVYIELHGEKKLVCKLARDYGMDRDKVMRKLKSGVLPEDIFIRI